MNLTCTPLRMLSTLHVIPIYLSKYILGSEVGLFVKDQLGWGVGLVDGGQEIEANVKLRSAWLPLYIYLIVDNKMILFSEIFRFP